MALGRLCKAEVIQLFVPHVVLREVQSQQSQKAKQLTIALLGSSLGLRSGKGALSDISAELHAIEELVTSKSDAILHAAESAFAGWIDENHVIVVKLDVDQAQAALEAYFTGSPPVKSVKNRADIPDAFIFEAVKSLVGDPIWVVTDDKALREACASLAQVAVFADLETVIKREEIQAELQSLEAATAEAVGAKQSSEQGGEEQQEAAVDLGALAKAFLDYQLSTSELTSTIERELGEKLMWKKIHSTSIPDDNDEATISMYAEPTTIDFEFDRLSYFGGREFSIPFSAHVNVTAFYYLFRGDVYLSEGRSAGLSDHNDNYYEAEEDFDIVVGGTIQVTLSKIPSTGSDISDDVEEVRIDALESIELTDD